MTTPSHRNRFTCFVLAACVLNAAAGLGADWPAYRKDAHRSGVTDEKLAFPLRRAWSYVMPQPPAPAWPARVKILNRADYDHAPQPVAAEGIVCFGSSSDDTIRALDAATGREKWRFITGGPVRLAPQIDRGKVYAASDDGFVYCLDAATGRPAWTFRAAPGDDMVTGNGRMISRWPVRTGLLVLDGVVYCVAGMWPAEGIYVYALEADTGKVIWCNDTSGFAAKGFQDMDGAQHQGEFIAAGVCPEGALLADGDMLLVPQGESSPAAYDRRSGRLVYLHPGGGQPGAGGTSVTIDGGLFYLLCMHRSRAIYLNAWSVATGRLDRSGNNNWLFVHSNSVVPQLTMTADGKEGMPFRTVRKGRVSVIVNGGKVIARDAYELALAGGALIRGEEDAVSAAEAGSGKELWRGEVNGEARGLAVAGGRLFVSTSTGQITCFAPVAEANDATAALHDARESLRSAATPEPQGPEKQTLDGLKQAGMTKGYALVFGDGEGRLSQVLAARTDLRVINVLDDRAAAAALREKLVGTTTLHGSRIQVVLVERAERLPFGPYFANAVIVAGRMPGLSGKELYRVLRPCGGVLLFPALAGNEADALCKQIGAPEGECRIAKSEAGAISVVRGQLADTFDFNTGPVPDKRVKWPLSLLWFGGPRPEQLADYREGERLAGPPLAAYGRYFVQGESSMSAVDAYNGCVLWTRPLPNYWTDIREFDGVLHQVARAGPREFTSEENYRVLYVRSIAANKDHVYITLGKGFFRGKSTGCIQMDALTGEQVSMYAPFIAPQQVSLDKPQPWTLEIDDKHSGTVSLRKEKDALVAALSTTDPAVTKLDAWELYFDLRPPEKRYGLYERETFSVRVVPALDDKTPATWNPHTGSARRGFAVSGRRAAAGTETELRLPWTEMEKAAGERPRSFGFAVTLNSHDGDAKTPVKQRHLFGDEMAAGLNNGWANVTVDGEAKAEVPKIVAGGAPPKGWMPGRPSINQLAEAVRLAPRVHALTGEPEPRLYRSGTWGCGGPTYSATCIFRRPSKPAIGIYDFADDSGLRFFGGISSPCGSSSVAACGLFIFSESRFRCDCNSPFRTSLALAPAQKRLNEDWAIYFDLDADTFVRQAALNLGAFGDRRDDKGTLWLAFPRESGKGLGWPLAPGARNASILPGVWMRPMTASMNVPVELEVAEGLGPYRKNADRVAVEGTDRPWIYASGICGIRRARMRTDFLAPLTSVLVREDVKIDGQIAFGERPDAALPFTKTDVWLRHDQNNLYVAARRPAVIGRKGEVVPWARKASGDDAPVWQDDSLEVFLGDTGSGNVMHLGVSASGARFDALGKAGAAEDKQWNAEWQCAVAADDKGLGVEIAIPWKTIAAAGLQKDSLKVNLAVNQSDTSREAAAYSGAEGRNANLQERCTEALCNLGKDGRSRCANFVPLGMGVAAKAAARSFTVRLHFAELEAVAPGQRVFDVKLQDRVVLKDFDVVKAAGGVGKAVVREFSHIPATGELALEFMPAGKTLTPQTAPIISGIELFDESFRAQ